MTLTQVSLITRRTIFITILLVIGLITFKIGTSVYYNYQLSHTPPTPPQAEAKFGTLPQIKFPNSSVSSSNYSYSIDTTTGELPTLPNLVKVYFIPQSQVSLLSPQKARELANKLGFDQGPEVSDNIYRFFTSSGDNLSVNITNGNFSFTREASSSADLPDNNRLVKDFKDYLSSKLKLPEDLISGRGSVVKFEASPSAQINLWPADLDELPIITSNPNRSLVRAVRVNSDNDQYSNVSYTFWEIDKTSYSTYFLKTTEQALQDIKGNLGFIVKAPQTTKVSITSVKLAYFESEDYTPFLQPVYIFEGPDFYSLVPAIR